MEARELDGSRSLACEATTAVTIEWGNRSAGRGRGVPLKQGFAPHLQRIHLIKAKERALLAVSSSLLPILFF